MKERLVIFFGSALLPVVIANEFGGVWLTAFFPIYGIWLTAHNIERKLNALLDREGIFMPDSE